MALNDLVPFRNRRRASALAASPSGAFSVGAFDRLHHEMDRLFDDFFPQLAGGRAFEGASALIGSVDLSESDDALELKADLPGVEESDIDVTLRNGALFISGERKHEHEEKKKNYYHAERAYGAFTRGIPLPCEVDEAGVKASFSRGVLTVHLPKSPKARAHERRIEVKAS